MGGLTALIQVAQENNISEEQVRQAVQHTGGHLMRAARRLGRGVMNAWREHREGNRELHHRQPDSLSNPPQDNTMGRARTMTNHAEGGGADEPGLRGDAMIEGGEQQVEAPRHIWRRFPNTETALLKWIQTGYAGQGSNGVLDPYDNVGIATATSLSTTGGGAQSVSAATLRNATVGVDLNTPQLMIFRMTSPYNILKFSSLPGAQTEYAQPEWLELFDSKYQYYHCMETNWKLDFNFGYPAASGSKLTDGHLVAYYIFWKYTNEDDPPTTWAGTTANIANAQAVNANDQIVVQDITNAMGTVPLTPDDYFRMGGWNHKRITLSTTHETHVHIDGEYKFGQCKMDIKTLNPGTDVHSIASATAEGWNQIATTPAFPENLCVIIVQDNATHANPGITTPLAYRVQTQQLVQFKDLRAIYKFPTPAAAKSGDATHLNTDAAFFWRGASTT